MPKFLVDRMLGQTAKWLRLMGVDAKYAPEGEDEKLLKIAEEEDRVLLTRDKELGRKEVAFLVEKAPPEDIIEKISDNYELDIEPLSRCSKCNGEVERVEKDEVEDEVCEAVLERQEKFWHCSKCGQYYWKGSHWDQIIEKIEEIVDMHEERKLKLGSE